MPVKISLYERMIDNYIALNKYAIKGKHSLIMYNKEINDRNVFKGN